MQKPTVICLTPVKNEEWVLRRFLTCANTWADHIIIADQGSDDASVEIARQFPKVRLVENKNKQFNEPERQKLLIEEARKIPGPRLLIALDADEIMTANFVGGRDREVILSADPGTVINFQWSCVLPGGKSHYIFPKEFPLGFMDDGAEHTGRVIHSPRIPVPDNSRRISLRETKVFHLATLDWARYTSKIRWYQCWEFLQGRWDNRLVDLYRWYHQDAVIPDNKKAPIPESWTTGYPDGIDIFETKDQPFFRWDRAILEFFTEYGPKKFRKLAIWDVDWQKLHHEIFGTEPSKELRDPRSRLDRSFHAWLAKTQIYHSRYPDYPERSVKTKDFIFRQLASLSGW